VDREEAFINVLTAFAKAQRNAPKPEMTGIQRGVVLRFRNEFRRACFALELNPERLWWLLGDPSNNAVHLTPAAGGSRDDNDTEPQAQVTADR
jgi:hypothetical protein